MKTSSFEVCVSSVAVSLLSLYTFTVMSEYNFWLSIPFGFIAGASLVSAVTHWLNVVNSFEGVIKPSHRRRVRANENN
jgi:hypothetical protein